VDQGRAVIDSLNLDALGKLPASSAMRSSTLSMTSSALAPKRLQDDAACDLALAVEFGQASTFVRSQFEPRDVLNENRRASVVLQDDLLQIGNALQ